MERPPREAIALRAQAPEDLAFLREVYGSTREEELARVPWSAQQKRAFLDQQFAAQKTHYEDEYPGAQFLVIELRGERIGRLYVDRDEEGVHIIDIALLPAWRGHGIGRMLLEELIEEARAAAGMVRIYVEQLNPARRLYDRLGFAAIETHGVYDLMEWRQDAAAVPAEPARRRARRGAP